ncbi:MAG: nicotinate-nucleotide--dimethylbenzimidazole phosphoribosyltransferase [Lachnoclostridium sp.]|nr:nicotinate-nucleotide--dimethylbenzimidazole phosphoribosyltransferase [Lachnospira sp.]MCM1247174.1 nicotinate-nucleotide--dimethylbenzimidazole phosphoribosyltransferase [Lachnoclostridium sp.]MCM1534605.1 nicotinate-nucleotide--dimethylbenzimidazole phosphoribosyltransferase [Clostridium sp.]
MECLEKLVWNNYTREELAGLSVRAPDEEIRKRVQKRWDLVAKPLDGMGKFETLIAQIGAVIGTEKIDISKKAVVIMCADNGIVEEGVSQSGQEVTLSVARSMGQKQSSVGQMAQIAGAYTIPVDIGINHREEITGVIDCKVRCGTRNFKREPAMTEEEAIQAIAAGMDLVCSLKQSGINLIATGEMGIGNTTTSSAVAASLLKCGADKVTGRGAGLDDEGLSRKKQVIADAIEKYDLYHADALTVLKTVGGLDIAGLAGVCMGGALYRMPIVLDGVISMTAALLAERILPGTKSCLLPSHKGKEPAVAALIQELDMEPVIDGGLALGEGTGAVMMFPLLDMALCIYDAGRTFSDIGIEGYTRF